MTEGWHRLQEWGGETVALCFGEANAEKWRRAIFISLAIAVLMPLLIFSAVTVAKRGYHPGLREAGEWLEGYAGKDTRIMNRESSSAFYSGGIPVFLPYAEYDRVNEYAHYQNVDYMVITRQGLVDNRPELAKRLLDAGGGHFEWKLVHTVRPGTPEETLIYEFEK